MAIKQSRYINVKSQIKEYPSGNNRLIESNIYLKQKDGLSYKVIVCVDNKNHVQYFDNLQEARAYRDELHEENYNNKSILKNRKNPDTLQRDAEMIEKFIALGMTAGEIAREYGVHESGMNAVLNKYYKPQDGVEIIVQSKINGIEDPDKIKNITFL